MQDETVLNSYDCDKSDYSAIDNSRNRTIFFESLYIPQLMGLSFTYVLCVFTYLHCFLICPSISLTGFRPLLLSICILSSLGQYDNGLAGARLINLCWRNIPFLSWLSSLTQICDLFYNSRDMFEWLWWVRRSEHGKSTRPVLCLHVWKF